MNHYMTPFWCLRHVLLKCLWLRALEFSSAEKPSYPSVWWSGSSTSNSHTFWLKVYFWWPLLYHHLFLALLSNISEYRRVFKTSRAISGKVAKLFEKHSRCLELVYKKTMIYSWKSKEITFCFLYTGSNFAAQTFSSYLGSLSSVKAIYI